MAASVLVVGDLMLDRYLHGTNDRLSSEGPILLVDGVSETICLGGAANVAANIVSLGGRAYLLGVAGKDPARDLMVKLASDKGIPHVIIGIEGERTHVKERTVVDNRTLLRYDAPHRPYTDEPGIMKAALACMDHAESEIKLLVISDYSKGLMTQSLAEALLRAAAERRIPTHVDARPKHVGWYRGATLYKPNLREALRYLDLVGDPHPGLGVADDDSAAGVAAQQTRIHGGFWGVVVTRGPLGATEASTDWTADGGNRVAHYPAPVIACCDVTGAGDTFMAGLAVGILEGRGLAGGIAFANLAASLAVQTHGTVVVPRIDVEDVSSQVIVSLQEALAYAKYARAAGRTLALASDCFDILGARHVEMLIQGAKLADVLLVAYNDDASLRALTNDSRLIMPGYCRAGHVAAVRGVARVFEFNGDAVALVRQFHPDVLVKAESALLRGPVPEADVVAGYGGRVEFVKMPDCIT